MSYNGIAYNVAPWSVTIVQNNIVLFNTATLSASTQAHVNKIKSSPASVFSDRIDNSDTKVEYWWEPMGAWSNDTVKTTLPQELIALTRDSTEYVFSCVLVVFMRACVLVCLHVRAFVFWLSVCIIYLRARVLACARVCGCVCAGACVSACLLGV